MTPRLRAKTGNSDMIATLLITASLVGYSHDDVTLHEYKALDVLCRGGSGNDTATQEACKRRDTVSKKLPSLGFCWHMGKSGAEDYFVKGVANKDGVCTRGIK